ncbi:MAG: APC family permease [Candidatus Coatesbacteria bacterium]
MRRGRPTKLTALGLLAATYCIVAGGPYGLEDIVGKAGGYAAAMFILIVTPLVWAIPTGLMVSELASAIPKEGGFYAWVRRAMGPFWGYQEAWLSLAGSMFDMAIYPTLFAAYLARLFPVLGQGWWPVAVGSAMIAVCVAWNLLPAREIGRGSAVLTALVLSPFVVLVGLALAHAPVAGPAPAPPGGLDLLGGVMVAMWNYMGWDNASTVAEEVERPATTYPLTMLRGVTIVTLSYVIPVAACAWAGIDLGLWSTGGWADIARVLGGTMLAGAVVVAGAAANAGTFNALVLSLTRLPMVMAEDGYLPRIFAWKHPKTGVPVVSLLASAATWAVCQGLGFVSVVVLDVLLSGLSMLLEFAALVVLRVREPGLRRPYRIPGGLWGVVAVCVGPTALIVLSFVRADAETILGMSGLVFSLIVIGLGPVCYWLSVIAARP